MSRPLELIGRTTDRFEPVRQAFIDNFRRGEIGASVCVWHDGKVVVDLVAGQADKSLGKSSGKPWTADTMAVAFSTTKGIVALAFLMLSDRGQIDYDAPVASYWPEFAAAGKDDISVRTLLNHRSGLIEIKTPITIEMLETDLDAVAKILAAQSPHWEPGTFQGYHGVTYGLYGQELFRRITGETLGGFIAREIAGPLEADFHLGLPAALDDRVATNYPANRADQLLKILPKLIGHRGTEGRVYRSVAFGGDAGKAFANPRELGPRGIANFNSKRVHRLELAWGGGIANARGLCRIYSALANGGTIDGHALVSTDAIASLHERQSWSERDRVLNKPVGWSQGFLKEGGELFSPNTESFGHAGAGGSVGWCDPAARVAIGYVMNRMDHHIRSPRALRLCHAVYKALGKD